MSAHDNKIARQGLDAPIPIFVLGSPRSGTTVLSAYLGTADCVVDFNELAVFYFTHWIARREYARVPTPLKERYLWELERHATTFALEAAQSEGAAFFCDSTPWNLRITDYLFSSFPRALFVLVLRNFAGVAQSLSRSYEDGWRFAGPGMVERARLWAALYANVTTLPLEQTIPISYDRLCAEPLVELKAFSERLGRFRFPTASLKLTPFAKSHAVTAPRPTLGQVDASGRVTLHPMASFDRNAWTGIGDPEAARLVAKIEGLIEATFPGYYCAPSGA
jgi:hypothetical protein